MMPVSNTGAGGTVGAPDPCTTPAAPSPVVVPYPNFGLTAQTFPFSLFVNFCMRPGVNLMSKIMTSMGMEAGVMHPLYKMMVSFSSGSPLVFVDKAPVVTMGSTSAGNGMNNAAGMVSIPSVVNVFACYAPERTESLPGLDDPYLCTLGADDLPMTGNADLELTDVVDRSATLAIDLITADIGSRAFAALRRAREELDELRIDLRGCRGGDLHGMLALASALLPSGTPLVTIVDRDGDEQPTRARGGAGLDVALEILVDARTASAAELLAGCLQQQAGATVIGERTMGKSTLLASTGNAAPTSEGPARTLFVSVAKALLPDGTDIEGIGITPDSCPAPQPAPRVPR